MCFSSLCFCFLEEFLEKEKAEGVEGLLVNWHMVQVLDKVFRYCTLGESRLSNTALVAIDFTCIPTLYKQATVVKDKHSR